MKFPLKYTFGLFVLVVALHFMANAVGLYEVRIVWFDNVLHLLVGFASGLLWLWVLEKKNWPYSFAFSTISLTAFVFSIVAAWELLEYFFFKFFTSYAYSLSIYSPSLGEAGTDIMSNLIGGLLLVLVIAQREDNTLK